MPSEGIYTKGIFLHHEETLMDVHIIILDRLNITRFGIYLGTSHPII